MLNRLVVFTILVASSTFGMQAQTSINEDFSDGDFINNPIWQGQETKFEVDTSGQLHLNDTSANSPAYLVTGSGVTNSANWEFFVHLDFPPSGSNFARVYLVSDQEDLGASLNGYFVQIGGQSGTIDEVSLYRQEGNADSILIDGIDGTVAIDPSLRVKVTKDSLANWELFIDTSTNFTGFVSQGTTTDNKISTSTYFGVFCRYTSTRSDKFFFDDIVVNGLAFQDTVPPGLQTVEVLTSKSLRLSFSEKLDPVAALNTSNYQLNKGGGAPSTLEFFMNDSSILDLAFNKPFLNGEDMQIKVLNILDLSGNSLLADSMIFQYFLPDMAEFKDVLINEIYPDFSPSNGLPEGEFIELFNASNKIFDLENWNLSDLNSTVQLEKAVLRPGEFIILCTSSLESDYAAYGTVMGISSFPSLNNGGDLVEIRDEQNRLIDALNYDQSCYQDPTKEDGGWTIELKDPFTECFSKNNYLASTAMLGGSPGQQNTVFDTLPDTIAPIFIAASILNGDSIILSFDEAIDSSSLLLVNFSISNGINPLSIAFWNHERDVLLLILDKKLDSGILVQLNISGLFDCSGNTISPSNTDVLIPGTPKFREVVINEFFVDFSPNIGLPEAEFIELFNASNKIFDLANWTLSDPTTKVKLKNHFFRPGEYVIICAETNREAYERFGEVQGLSAFPSLNNAGDEILLEDDRANRIDMLSYDDSWYRDEDKKEGGYTLEQINPQLPCNGSFNFIGSEAELGGTPGGANSVLDTAEDRNAPTLLEVLVLSQDSLELIFNEGIDTLSLVDAVFSFSSGNMIDTLINSSIYGSRLLLTLLNPLDSGRLVEFAVQELFDCSGNSVEENLISIVLPEKAAPLDLVINEVLFNPRTGGEDFLELFNRSDKVISLKNWQLANVEDAVISNLKIISEKPALIFPGEYIGLCEDIQNIVFEYPFTQADRFLELDAMPAYNNDEGTAVLLNHRQLVIDRVSYNEDMHFELLDDIEGVSLERLDPDRSSNDLGNFHSAAESQNFATPGYENSQFFKSPNFNGEINIEPKVFSPDNDGHQDLLNINYRFNAPGFVANVSIYDRNGRLAKQLINNELLGKEGVFTWNGTTDDNEKARLGVYIILIETFHPNGEKEIFKETAVLGGFLD